MKSYELIDHTADIGVKAFGLTVNQAFEHAAKAMFDVITDNSDIAEEKKYNIELEASDLEQLLVDWLSELLYLHDVDRIVFGRFKIRISNNQLIGSAFGEWFDPQKHRIGMEIKAVTYHMLEVHDHFPIYVTVLFDI